MRQINRVMRLDSALLGSFRWVTHTDGVPWTKDTLGKTPSGQQILKRWGTTPRRSCSLLR